MSDEVNLTRQPWTPVSPALEDAESLGQPRQYRGPGPGLVYGFGFQALEDLIGRTLAGSQRSMHGCLKPVKLGRFAGEEQRVLDRAGESRLRLDPADSQIGRASCRERV